MGVDAAPGRPAHLEDRPPRPPSAALRREVGDPLGAGVTGGAGELEPLENSFASRRFGSEVLAGRADLCDCRSRSTIRQERGEYDGEQQVFVAAAEDDVRALLDAWAAERPDTHSWANLHPAPISR
jgi:hypothetical protein